MWFATCCCITENLSFLNSVADWDKIHRWVWYYLRMWVLLVFCWMVMISPVLCLLDVLHIIPSLSKGNLSEDWEATMASLQNESSCWVYSEMPLLSSSGPPWKVDPANVTMWGWPTIRGKDPHHLPALPANTSEGPSSVKHYCTTDCPWVPLGSAVWSEIGWLLDTQVQLVG